MAKHEIVVELSWPAKELSVNSHRHWRVRWKAAKAYRAAAFYRTKSVTAESVPDGSDSVRVQLTYFPPTARHYDEDNLLGRMKSALDGIADALQVNDSCFHYLESAIAEPRKPAGVRVRISFVTTEVVP